MREILLTSSVLILAVLLLRRAFRDRISRRAQYVLWALVLVRLLVPVSLPGSGLLRPVGGGAGGPDSDGTAGTAGNLQSAAGPPLPWGQRPRSHPPHLR